MKGSPGTRVLVLRTLIVAWAGATAVLTLIDTGSVLRPVASHPLCFACGTRGLADVLANCALFVPFGLLVGWLRGPRFALAASALATLTIEGTQVFLPGRDPAFQDLVANTAGGGIGALLAAGVSHRLVASVAPVLAAALWLAPFFLLSHVPARAPLFGQLAHRRPDFEQYSGKVLGAFIGPHPIPARDVEDPERVVASIALREPLRVELVVGTPPSALAPIAAILDRRGREVILVGAIGEDLLIRGWSRARELRLDQPDARWPGAFTGLSVGDTVSVMVDRSRGSWCATVGAQQRCGLGPGPGDGYAFLLNLEGGPEIIRWLAAAGWSLLVGAVIGLAGSDVRRSLTIAVGLALTGLALGFVSADVRPSVWQALALVIGTVGGGMTATSVGRLVQWIGGRDHAASHALAGRPPDGDDGLDGLASPTR